MTLQNEVKRRFELVLKKWWWHRRKKEDIGLPPMQKHTH
jgi:hypothetical protein